MAPRALLVSAMLMGAAVARAAPAESPPHVVPVTKLAPGERRPVLFFLHGLGGSGADALGDSTFRTWAETFRVHLVAPDGIIDHQGRRFWNAGGACCNFDNRPVDDIARLERLIDQWRERPDVDPARVYVVGPPPRLLDGRSPGRRRQRWRGRARAGGGLRRDVVDLGRPGAR
jgi:poly(3-hydroxybutyrate) depolymerase